MPIKDRVRDKAPAFKGQKSAQPIESYGIESAEQIKNFYIHNRQLNQSPGSIVFADALLAETGGIQSIIPFNDLLIVQRNLSLTFGLTVAAAAASFQDVISTLSSSNKMQGASWRTRLFLSNRQDAIQLKYDYTVSAGSWGLSLGVAKFGLDPCGPLLAANISNGTAGNLNAGDMYYMIAMYDSTVNVESPCGGAHVSSDGLFELSPNGFLGPTPALSPNNLNKQGTITYAHIMSLIDAHVATYGQRATHFIIYRSGAKVGGLYDSFFRVPNKNGGATDGNVLIDINTFRSEALAFIDDTPASSLAAVSPPENNSPPPTPARLLSALTYAQGAYSATANWATVDEASGFRHMRFFRDQLFGVGAVGRGFTVTQNIAISADTAQKVTGNVTEFRDFLHGSEVYQPEYFTYRWEIGRGDGQESIGLGVLGDVALLVFKESSAYYLSGSSPDNYVLRIMDGQKGCINENTIQETPVGVITLDRSGFILWNKIGQGERISDDVHDVIDKIDFIYASAFYSCYDAKLNLYRCSVVVEGSITPSLTFVLQLDTMEWSIEKGSEGLCRAQFSMNSNNLTAATAAAGISLDGSGTIFDPDSGKVYDFVGDRLSGQIHDYSNITSVLSQGSAIESIWTSGTINFGDDQHKKKMEWLYIRAKSFEGWKIKIEVIPDYDESRKYELDNWDVVGSQSEWYSSDLATDGSLLWDSGDGSNDGGRWASDGQTRQVTKIPIKCTGYTFQVRIIRRETDTARYGFAIESVSAEGVMFGR